MGAPPPNPRAHRGPLRGIIERHRQGGFAPPTPAAVVSHPARRCPHPMSDDNAPVQARTKTRSKRPKASDPAPPSEAPPTWRPRALVALLALLGLGGMVAAYMTVAHLELFHGTGSFKSICNFDQHLSCDAVNTSDQSEVGGIAIAVFAIPVYATLGFLVAQALGTGPKRGRFALALAHALAWPAVFYSLYLLSVMLFQLGTLCLFCLTLDVVNASALVLTAWSIGARPPALLAEIPRGAADARRIALPAAGIGAAVLALSLVAHGRLRASLEAEARAAVVASGTDARPRGSAGAPDEGGDDATSSGKKLPTKRWDVEIDDDDASIGPKDAKVTVVQFADFQCGYCKKLEHAMAAARKTYEGKVRFVFKHFPMNPRCNKVVQNEKHKYACEAALSGECARRQGKFWPMHAELYKNQHRLERSDLDHYAELAGLEPKSFAACMSDPSAMEAVLRDTEEGGRVKVNGTPRTFVNGRLFSGVLSEDLLDFVIRIELGEVTGKAAECYAAPSAAPQGSGTVAAAPAVHVAFTGLDFQIDRFEASIDAAGKAASVPGVLPAEVTYDEARAACDRAGKRLCSSEEWVSAAKAPAPSTTKRMVTSPTTTSRGRSIPTPTGTRPASAATARTSPSRA